MLLAGHGDEVFTCRFNPDGDVLASGSNDKHVFLWRTYGDCENYMILKGAHARIMLHARFFKHCVLIHKHVCMLYVVRDFSA